MSWQSFPSGRDPDHAWFQEAGFGMFIHWGAYSVAGRGEWAANRERIPFEEYRRRYAERFRAERYDPSEWAELAVAAGMRYGVLTARHHDGFALWPTKTSEFHAGRFGPQRDLVGPFVEAFRAAGLKVGLYFSPADWFHPDYPGAYFRDWPEMNDWRDDGARQRFIDYYRAQLRELLTGYGRIDYLWYDGCIPSDLRSSEANEEALRLQPHLLINERNGPPCHVRICEQAIKPPPPGVTWEACMTLNDNWGYHASDHNWKTPLQILKMLAETASGEGNLLLNVGPDGSGMIPEPSEKILREVGRWLSRNERAIRNSVRCPFGWINPGKVTTSGNQVFLHLWNHSGGEVCYSEIANDVLSVRLLDGDKALSFEQCGQRLFIRGLPETLPGDIASAIVVEVEGSPRPITKQTAFWIPGE